jgi:hydroxymethylglutaryl-CoA lyase/(R)-citramalyl-CoA lyase
MTSVTLREVAPRDGLQAEAVTVEVSERIELISRLAGAGVSAIEVGSFVNPDRVPQMAGADAVARESANAFFSASGLVLNERGYTRLIESGLREAVYALPVTDSYIERNQGTTVDGAIEVVARIADRAREDECRLTVILAVAFGCPFSGAVPPSRVLDLAARAADSGANALCVADTIGVAVPRQVRELVASVAGSGLPVGVHLHNTRNTGYANALAAVEAGASWLDSSVGGVGGCPFAPRATGNIATEDLAYLLRGEGVETGVDIEALIDVAGWLTKRLGHPLPGELHRAGDFVAAPARTA